jgi:hypothetical protein
VLALSARHFRPVVAAIALLGCAEGSPPTQPNDAPVIATMPKEMADVIVADLPSTIYACVVSGKGLIYRIKVPGGPTECAKGDIAFSWVPGGVPGPEGPRGPEGPQGIQGVQGPGGPITGLTFHSEGVTLPADGRWRATCEAGKSVVTFGWEIPFGTSNAVASQIKGARPALVGTQVVWGFQAAPGTVYVFYWTCANSEPATQAP